MHKLICLLLLVSSLASATDLIVINETGTQMRIEDLKNACQGSVIKNNQPIRLAAGESYTFKDLAPVIQTYTVCGAGYCSATALGVTDLKTYTLRVTLDKGLITGRAEPDHWKNSYRECK